MKKKKERVSRVNKKETETRGEAKGMPLTVKGRRVTKDYLIEHGIIKDYFTPSKEEKGEDCIYIDTIYRQDAIDLLRKWSDGYSWLEVKTDFAIEEFKQLSPAQQKVLKYTGESICLYCHTTNCDGCMYEPMTTEEGQ